MKCSEPERKKRAKHRKKRKKKRSEAQKKTKEKNERSTEKKTSEAQKKNEKKKANTNGGPVARFLCTALFFSLAATRSEKGDDTDE